MAGRNCWEVMGCGREPGGFLADHLGPCPVPMCQQLDGAHGGQGAGRACWVVVGTFCTGHVEGTFAKKLATCESCPFYDQVRAEQGDSFVLAPRLARLLRRRRS